jgi:hypothetical protein
MKTKPALLFFTLALALSPLLPGVAHADGGWNWGQHGYRDDHGYRGHGYHDRKHRKARHRKGHKDRGYRAPRVVYRDRPIGRYGAGDSLTIILNGSWR